MGQLAAKRCAVSRARRALLALAQSLPLPSASFLVLPLGPELAHHELCADPLGSDREVHEGGGWLQHVRSLSLYLSLSLFSSPSSSCCDGIRVCMRRGCAIRDRGGRLEGGELGGRVKWREKRECEQRGAMVSH
eukprot:2270721-Rhodomonas_salina.1